ncbi:mCG144640, partial [Mus musculus]
AHRSLSPLPAVCATSCLVLTHAHPHICLAIHPACSRCCSPVICSHPPLTLCLAPHLEPHLDLIITALEHLQYKTWSLSGLPGPHLSPGEGILWSERGYVRC